MIPIAPSFLLLLAPLLAIAQTTEQSTPIPEVSLLLDAGLPANITLRCLLDKINDRKLKDRKFVFGSTLAALDIQPTPQWTSDRFKDTFNAAVAENECKSFAWYEAEGVVNASRCIALRDYAEDRGNDFRLHNTFWHSQRPDFLTYNATFSVQDLNQSIIPFGVETMIKDMGKTIFSVDVVNEPWSDSANLNDSSTQCVLDAERWPNWSIDGMTNSTKLFPDESFIATALRAADKARTDLGLTSKEQVHYINDYNIGGTVPVASKTECAFKTLEKLQREDVPIDGLGLQSHYSATVGGYPSKADLHFTMDRLNKLGLQGAITELDVWLPDNSTESFRLQAAIFGDSLDVCLYSPNCFEFIVWDNRDDQSWLSDFDDRGVAQGTLFDANGQPKLAYQEVILRLERFIDGLPEPCATSGGTEICVLEGYGKQEMWAPST